MNKPSPANAAILDTVVLTQDSATAVTPRLPWSVAMAFAKPAYSKAQINRAGEILKSVEVASEDDLDFARAVLTNWRACHAYPINTFQATLRDKLERIDDDAIVAQRLKRASSIVVKLQRFDGMQLARMQDIGGLRAVVSTVGNLKRLEDAYRTAKFKHGLISSKDYVSEPKQDGYRSIHLIYRYENEKAIDYNGLSLELQLRTLLQHAWSTAVETMGTFLGQALKSGQGEDRWRSFFAKASAGFAATEGTSTGPQFSAMTKREIFLDVAEAEQKLGVLHMLTGMALAANQIAKRGSSGGAYHLIILNSDSRTVQLRAFSKDNLEAAAKAYSNIEESIRDNPRIDAVLVRAGNVIALKKAYPNYFLDTEAFSAHITRIIASAKRSMRHPAGKKARTAKRTGQKRLF